MFGLIKLILTKKKKKTEFIYTIASQAGHWAASWTKIIWNDEKTKYKKIANRVKTSSRMYDCCCIEICQKYRMCSLDVTAAMLDEQNKGTAAMLEE